MSTGVIYQTGKKIRTRLNLPLNMICTGRRYHIVGDMNPLAGIPSPLVGEARGSLEWSSITRPSVSVMLRKIEDNNKKKIISQRTSRESQKVWRLMKF